MRIDTLKERITNAKAKIEKKTATIEKKKAQIEKKSTKLEKLGFTEDSENLRDNNEAFWTAIEIKNLKEDIERNRKEISEIGKSLAKYELQMSGELEKESLFVKDVPEALKRMQNELVDEWNKYDKNRRDRLKAEYRELGYKAFFEKHNKYDYDFKDQTDEQIERRNEQDAKDMIINLIYRVRDVVGEITDWGGIRATIGTWGGTVLNGFVIGTEGQASIESIYAGGYNIQRLHVRVLVKPW